MNWKQWTWLFRIICFLSFIGILVTHRPGYEVAIGAICVGAIVLVEGYYYFFKGESL
jgi:hypothetical protein